MFLVVFIIFFQLLTSCFLNIRRGSWLLWSVCPSDQDPGDEHPGEAAGAGEPGGGGAQQAGPAQEAALQDLGGRQRGAVSRDNFGGELSPHSNINVQIYLTIYFLTHYLVAKRCIENLEYLFQVFCDIM